LIWIFLQLRLTGHLFHLANPGVETHLPSITKANRVDRYHAKWPIHTLPTFHEIMAALHQWTDYRCPSTHDTTVLWELQTGLVCLWVSSCKIFRQADDVGWSMAWNLIDILVGIQRGNKSCKIP
jgi:hypothetical protein